MPISVVKETSMENLRFESTDRGFEKATGTVEVAGSKVPFTIEQPDWRHFGGDISDGVVVYLSGWTESEDSLKSLRHATARLGMAAVTIQQPRYYRPDKVLRAPELRVENAATITRNLNNMYPSVHLAGHSLGGTEAVRVAAEYEACIETLTLLGSAGLIASDGFRQVAPRVFEEIVSEELYSLRSGLISKSGIALESIKMVLRNPALATNEGVAAATHYVGRHIQPLLDKGLYVANVMADEDKIFPYQQVLESTGHIPFSSQEVFTESCHNFTAHRPNEVAQLICAVTIDASSVRQQRAQAV